MAGCERKSIPGAYEGIALNLLNGKLKPDFQGVVQLPPDSAQASIDGKVFVTNSANGVRMLFRTWIGKGGNLSGYLYAPGQSLKIGSTLEVRSDAPEGIGPTEVIVEKALKVPWYIVHRGDD